MPSWRGIAIGALCVALGACGGGGDDAEPAAESGVTTTTAAATAPGAAGSSSASVPDACTLLTNADIAAAIGTDPGTPEKGGGGSRTVCTYKPSGFIIGVSKGNQYDASARMARNENATCEDVTGVGQKAQYCVVFKTVAQLMWQDGSLMFDITAVENGAPVPLEDMKVLAGKVQAG